MVSGTTTFATQSATLPSGCTTGGCGTATGSFAGYDVWYSVPLAASGNLSVILAEISAGPSAFAVYTGTPGLLTQVANSCSCNGFVSLSGLPTSGNAYIRVWPESGLPNMGTFNVCAYEPIPPPNDNPCGALVLPVSGSCSLTTFTTESATNLAANITTSPATPSCGTPVAGGDVWFQVTPGFTGSMTINSQAGTLTDMAMAVYTLTAGSIASPCPTAVPGTLTEVAGGCNDTNGASTMPSVTIGVTNGTTYYVRMWNKTAAFGTASICAVQNVAPANDNPCGAIALPVGFGCTFPAPFSTQFATISGATPPVVSLPPASCSAGPYTSDVWFSAVVPASGQLQLDTDNGQLADAAMAVYTATGTCAGNNLSLTQIPGACSLGGSANGAAMPVLNLSGITPGTTVYIRIWRQGATDGTFQLCARNPVTPVGCYYTLGMSDSAGDGWNGGYVTLCIGGSCTNYSVYGSLSTIVFTAAVGQVVVVSYTAVGGFQNQVSFGIQASNGFNIWVSPPSPTTGTGFGFTVDAACNVPAAPISDCLGAFQVCNNQNINLAPGNFGNTQDLGPANRGCLASNERQGAWYRFTTNTTGTIAFTINVAPNTDYDFGVWGPYAGTPPCPPPTPPMRCSWSGLWTDTGLSYTDVDLTEGAGGNAWVRWIDALPNQNYLVYIDNYSMNGLAFQLEWNNVPNTILDCVLPVEFLEFEAFPGPRHVDLKWSTASERNSAYFQVERSADGFGYQPVGLVPAMGNSNTITEYTFMDKEPLNGVNYYRLDQVDADGEGTYSPVVTAVFRAGDLPLHVYPNPAGESLWASLELPDEGTVHWRILDASGRVVRAGVRPVGAGVNQVEIPLDIDAGSYLLDLTDQDGASLGNARFVRR